MHMCVLTFTIDKKSINALRFHEKKIQEILGIIILINVCLLCSRRTDLSAPPYYDNSSSSSNNTRGP